MGHIQFTDWENSAVSKPSGFLVRHLKHHWNAPNAKSIPKDPKRRSCLQR